MSNKPGVTGIGGVFFKAQKPENLRRWYETHLGLTPMDAYGHNFRWNEPDTGREALTVWSPFSAETKYFEPSTKPYMVNFRVRHLDELLAQLRAAGVTVDDKMEELDYGRFAWIMDPEGNRIELWEPTEKPPIPEPEANS
ncbi:MAG: VOC family protein [Nannocystaceae bacterium]